MNYLGMARSMGDAALVSSLQSMRRDERKLHCRMLAMIGEVERRLLFAEAGYSSLFQYLVSVLGYSEPSALKRIQVARLARQFPRVLQSLEEGRVSLAVLTKIAPHMKVQNASTLLSACEGKSVREVERFIVSKFQPKPARPDQVMSLDADRVSFYFAADRGFEALVAKAKAKLSHKYPEGRLKDIFTEALQSLLNDEKVRRKAVPKTMETASRHIPVAVKNQVWERDQASCSFVSQDGKRCGSTHFLEWDHVVPFGLGGSSQDPSNIRVLCRSHNRLMATQVFGRKFIERKIEERSKTAMEKALNMNRFMLDMWSAGDLKTYKKRDATSAFL